MFTRYEIHGNIGDETFLLSAIEKEDLPVFGVREAIALLRNNWMPRD